MLVQVGASEIQLVRGDITQQQVDALVNAANHRLAGGAGVDGAIHRAGGPTLMQETNENYPDGCPTGHAVATSAGDLSARFVFHAVGPVWHGGRHDEAAALQSVHRVCLELAIQHECQSIAFPAISTGAYGYPIDLAAETALTAVSQFLIARQKPRHVRFVLFSAGDFAAFAQFLESLTV